MTTSLDLSATDRSDGVYDWPYRHIAQERLSFHGSTYGSIRVPVNICVCYSPTVFQLRQRASESESRPPHRVVVFMHSVQPPPVKIYNAVYSSVQVYECMVRGIAVMRRRGDSYVNATQILKVAGIEKGRRTKILEKEILPGKHEIVQGGYGKYQGTWYTSHSPVSPPFSSTFSGFHSTAVVTLPHSMASHPSSPPSSTLPPQLP